MHNDRHHIREQLQREIDLILENVDEKTLFAEFRQEEIFDIQNGDRKEVVRHTLDERILTERNFPSRRTSTRVERHTTLTSERGKLAKLARYLFKQF